MSVPLFRYSRISVFLKFFWITFVLAIEQGLEIYTEIDQGGTGLLIRDKIADLQDLAPHIVNNVRSFCIQGRWRLYPNRDFTFDDIADVLAFATKTFKCHNSGLGNSTGSARYLGSSDTEAMSIAFYSDENQMGSEVVVEAAELNELPFNPRSLITTGESSWTVWTEKDYQGHSICYNSTKRVVVLNSMHNIIGSVKQNCVGDHETVILDDVKSAVVDLIVQAEQARYGVTNSTQ